MLIGAVSAPSCIKIIRTSFYIRSDMNRLSDFPVFREEVSEELGRLVKRMEELLRDEGAMVHLISLTGDGYVQYVLFASMFGVEELESFFRAAKEKYQHLTFDGALKQLEEEGFIRIIANLIYVLEDTPSFDA